MTDPTTTPTPTNDQQDVRGAAFGVTPGKPYPEHLYPGCPCAACDRRNVMNLCPTCGNKRCPAAMDHARWACSGSNEPGHAPTPLAAVSAAAPDERARDIAWNGWIDDHRDHALEYIQRLTAERDALAAQLDALRAECDRAWDVAVEERLRRLEAQAGIESPPEPEPDPLTGRLPARVEYGLVWDDRGSADTFPTLEQARAAARGFDEPAQVVRIETWPVADEGRVGA